MDERDESATLQAFLSGRDTPCPHCGYNLRGLTAGACPECEHALRLQLEPVDRPPSRRVVFFLLLAAAGVARGLVGAIVQVYDLVRSPVPFAQNWYGISSGIWVCLSLWLAFICASGGISIFLVRDTPACGKALEQFTKRALLYLAVSTAISLVFLSLRLWW